MIERRGDGHRDQQAPLPQLPRSRGGRCNCNAGWEASVFSKRENKKIRKTFTHEAEAKSWRADALAALARGGPKPTTVGEAWDTWHAGALDGTIRNVSGDRYKPAALRTYERAMRLRVLPELGASRVADLRRPDVQALADGLLSNGLNPSTIRNTFLPLRAIFNRAVAAEEIAVSPCTGIKLPAVRAKRDRIVGVAEAEALLAAVADNDRALWATAMYAGLRLGELQALRVESIDLAGGVIHVERGWDAKEGVIAPKSRTGRRRVPIAGVLRDQLLEHLMANGRTGDELAFGRTPTSPFDPSTVQDRADRAWRAARLERVTPHQCRHTFASLMIAAGVNAKALSTFMGHAAISITLDLYGHLMPGSEAEAAALLDDYVASQRERAEGRARGADLSGAPS